MKKILAPFCAAILIVLTCLLINACKKNQTATTENEIPPADMLKAAKEFQDKETNTSNVLSINVNSYVLEPVWKEVRYLKTANGKPLIVVASPIVDFDQASKIRGIRKFVFAFDSENVSSGQIIEIFGAPDYIEKNQGKLIESLSSGNESDFTGYEIIYDLNYNFLDSYTYVNGKKTTGALMVRGDNGEHRKLDVKGGGDSPIVTLGQCYAYYLISTNLSTGIQTWTYLYTLCDQSGGGGYGDGGGGGGSPGPSVPTAIFGENNSNAQISDTNFDAFLDYARTQGVWVGDPYNGTVTVNGTVYYGQFTTLKNSSGQVIANYFSPDATSGPFKIGFEYNIGNGNTATNTPQALLVEVGNPFFGTYPTPTTNNGGGINYGATIVDRESVASVTNNDPDIVWWNDNTTSFPAQVLPTWANMYANYPKNSTGGDMPGPNVYSLVGGAVLAAYNSSPVDYQNGCALRVSRALNYSGVNIPQITGQTYKGADNKNYFLSSAKLYNFMKKTFGAGDKILTQSDGGTNGSLFQSKLSGHKGIYIMQASYPAQFHALGHCTLYTGFDCIGGHNYFNAQGGVDKITLWYLN